MVAADRAKATEAAIVAAFNAAAERIENLVKALDGRGDPDRARG